MRESILDLSALTKFRDLRGFKTNGSFVTRIMIDFLDLPEQKLEIRQSAAIEKWLGREGKCIYNESSILFITQLDRQWRRNKAPITKTRKLLRRSSVRNVSVFCLVCFIVIKITRRKLESDVHIQDVSK